MKKIIILLGVILTGCIHTSSPYLKDIYYIDRDIIKYKKKDTLLNYFNDTSECKDIIFDSIKFIINHIDDKSLHNLYFNIYFEQKKVYSGMFQDTIVTTPFNLCIGKLSGNYIWFTGIDTITHIAYSWGQKNTVPIKLEYNITLLQRKNSDENEYIIY